MHESEQPMDIAWGLPPPLPGELFATFAAAVWAARSWKEGRVLRALGGDSHPGPDTRDSTFNARPGAGA